MPDESSKSIFVSKTFWVNVLAVLGMVVQGLTGQQFLVDTGTQATILAVLNIVLRTVTKQPVNWS